jgi:hypothetical protein
MDNTTIYWGSLKKEEIDAFLESNTKYSKIIIDGFQTISSELLKILEKNEIKEMEILNCQLTSLDFQQILEAVDDDLRTILVTNSLITDDVPLSEIQKRSSSKLIDMRVADVNMQFVKHFLGARELETIIMKNSEQCTEEDIEMMVQFLASQQKLKNLALFSNLNKIFSKLNSMDFGSLNHFTQNPFESANCQRKRKLKKNFCRIMSNFSD